MMPHFDCWCAASNVSTFEELCDLVLLEQFRNIVTDNVATYINDLPLLQKLPFWQNLF